jgi:hypothetical protein
MIYVYFLPLLILANFNSLYAQWEKVNVDILGFSEWIFPNVGDLEDDGDIDILLTRLISKQPLTAVSLWYGAPAWIKYEMTNDVGQMNAIDINKDGKNDIVAANALAGEVVWYEAPSWNKHVIGTLEMAALINSVDLDKDGDIDVVVVQAITGNVVWYEAPYWSVHTIGSCSNDPGVVVVADMDLDGDSDVIVSSQSGIFLFKAPNWNLISITGTTGIFQSSQIDVGDIDLDGDIDVVYSNEKMNMVVWYENPSWTQHIIDPNLVGATGVALADLDKDGNLDVIASGKVSNEVVWYKSPFWNKYVIDSSLGGASGLCAADMNGDGLTDLVACGVEFGNIVLYISRRTGIPSDHTSAKFPKSIKLHQNYPNPFNPITTIEFELPKSGNITLKIFDVSGKEIKTLINSYKSIGIYKIDFDATDLTTGIYYYQLHTISDVETRKMLLLR